MHTIFDPITLGTGIVDVGWPTPGSTNPDNYMWDKVGILDPVDGFHVEFPAELAGQYGTLVAVCGEPRELRDVDYQVRRSTTVYPAGTEVHLGRGKVSISRMMLGTTSSRRDNTAVAVTDMITASGEDTENLRAVVYQPGRLEFCPDRQCEGWATCQRTLHWPHEHCEACREDGWGNECANCGAPGGGSGQHGYCNRCHDPQYGMCHICYPDN